jgi:hypothetical protein
MHIYEVMENYLYTHKEYCVTCTINICMKTKKGGKNKGWLMKEGKKDEEEE